MNRLMLVNYSLDNLYWESIKLSDGELRELINAIYELRNYPHSEYNNKIITKNGYQFTIQQAMQYYPELYTKNNITGLVFDKAFTNMFIKLYRQRYQSINARYTWIWLSDTAKLWKLRCNNNQSLINEIKEILIENINKAYTPSIFAKWVQINVDECFKEDNKNQIPKIKGIG